MNSTKKKVAKLSPQEQWLSVLKDRGVKQIWLADKTGISPEHISNLLSERVALTEENRIKINEVLGTSF